MMAASGLAKVASTVIFFVAFTYAEGEYKVGCDVQGASTCYSGIGRSYGIEPFTNPRSQEKKNYLDELCKDLKSEPNFPAEPQCKQQYVNCADAEKKKFTSMEGGYAALRDAVGTPDKCQPVASLRDCLDQEVILKWKMPDPERPDFEGIQKANIRGAEELKKLLSDAAKPCMGKHEATAIAQLQKIATAIVDLNTLSDGRNAASRMSGAVAVLASLLLSFLFRSIY